jgi:predicted ATPase/class 3 adenylate cyclase
MTEREKLEQAIAALEAQRATLGDAVVDTTLAALRQQLAALPAQRAAEERKQVTVLFADIFGFTEMAEAMDIEEVRDTINALWARLDAAIMAEGGTIDKHIGDAVMALFGVPTAHEDDPERAIRAALAMQDELRSFAGGAEDLEIDVEDLPPLQIRIGIHTGPVLLGEVGTTAEYTAMGDAVNVAYRLQHAAPVGSVLISHDTYRQVRGIFDVQPLEPISVKGKAEPIKVYIVRDTKPRTFHLPTRGVRGIETRMIGRDAELRQLQEALDRVIENRETQVITVVGEAGVGKSRLLYEFNNWVELLPKTVLYFRGRATQQTSKLPYFLIRDLFSFRFQILESDLAVEAREKLEQGIVGFMGADGREKAHFIGHLIGFDFSGSPYLRGILDDARQIHDRAVHYATQFFTATTADLPAVVILLEDVHWADDTSLDLIDYLARECRNVPLLIVCLARPSLFEGRSSWGEPGEYHTLLELRPLPEEDSRRLVAEILREVEEIPPALRDLIVNKAEGNPFYVEEVIKMLIEDGVIVSDTDGWRVEMGRLAEVQVPPALTGVLQARLERLPPTEREMLQRASVVGRIFWDGVLAQIGQEGRDEVQAVLGELRRKELVFGRGASTFAGEQEYIFKHGVLHEVTYESALLRPRQMYHAQVASWLIERGGERAGGYAGLIGEHYERAGETGQAAEWYGRAARQAQDTYAPETAIGYYQKALEFLESSEASEGPEVYTRRLELYEGLGEMLRWQARFTEAAEAYTSMLAAAEAMGDTVQQARALNGLSWAQDLQGEHRAALESAGRAEQMARKEGAQVELVTALFNKGWASYGLGNVDGALALGEQALALSTELDPRRAMARSLTLLSAIATMLGRYKEAAQHTENALWIFQGLGDRAGVGAMLNNLGEIARLQGDYRSAAKLYQDVLATAQEIGDREGEMMYLTNLGGARVGLREYGAAEIDLRQVTRMDEAAGWFGLAETYRFLAEACLGQRKIEEALTAARQALALGQETELQEVVGATWRVLGQLAEQLSDPVTVGDDLYDVEACFGESVRIFSEMGMGGEQARTLREWARHELQRGDRARGEKMWQEARELFAQLGLELEVERTAKGRGPGLS